MTHTGDADAPVDVQELREGMQAHIEHTRERLSEITGKSTEHYERAAREIVENSSGADEEASSSARTSGGVDHGGSYERCPGE
jgi:hypothetical protein